MALIEQLGKRTRNATHFWDNVAQRYVAVLSIHDQHYRDDADTWQDCVESWEADGADGFEWGMARLRHRVRLVQLTGVFRYHPLRGAPLKYVTVGRPERKGPGQSWPDMVLGTRSQNGNLMSFDTGDHGYDVQSTWRQVKTYYRLKDSTAPIRLRWPITFNNLTFDWPSREVRDGATVVARLEPTTAHDANGDPVNVVESWDGSYLELSIDTAGAAFPITVDPTFTDGPGGDVTTAKDNRLVSGSPTFNTGANANWVNGAAANTRGLIEFDLSSIDASSTCDSATFSTFQRSSGAALAFTLTAYSIAAANAAWIEGTQANAQAGAGEPCWNALAANGAGGITTAWAGDVGGDGGADAGLTQSGTDYEAVAMGTVAGNRSDPNGTEYAMSLGTTRVAGWFGASNTNYGMLVLSDQVPGSIASSDEGTSGWRPKLVVVYTAAGGATRTATPITGALSGIFTRTASSVTAAIQYIATRTATPVTAALAGTFSRTATPVTTALSGIFSRTASSVTAALSGTFTRTATPVTSTLSGIFTRTATPVTGALQGTFTRIATSVSASIGGGVTRTATPITAALSGVFTRTATSVTAALQGTSTRTTTTVTAALAFVSTRIATPITAALAATTTRTATTITAALSGSFTRSATTVTAALSGTFTRTATTVTASLTSQLTRTASSVTAALSGSFTRTASTITAALSGTFIRTASSVTASLATTLTRTASSVTASLTITLTRTASSVTAALQGTLTRTASTITAALTAVRTRTASTVTASLSAAAITANVALSTTRNITIAFSAAHNVNVSLSTAHNINVTLSAS